MASKPSQPWFGGLCCRDMIREGPTPLGFTLAIAACCLCGGCWDAVFSSCSQGEVICQGNSVLRCNDSQVGLEFDRGCGAEQCIDGVCVSVTAPPVAWDAGNPWQDTNSTPAQVCVADPYVPTAAEQIYYDEGCTEGSDVEWVQSLAAKPDEASKFRQTLVQCLLMPPNSCSGAGDTTTADGLRAMEQCVKDCLLKDKELDISESCANCYAVDATCGFVRCIAQCAANPSSQGCLTCRECNCVPVFVACQQLP